MGKWLKHTRLNFKTHMGQLRFNFYLCIILNTLNTIKLDGFINIIDSQQLSKFNSIKRKTCEDV